MTKQIFLAILIVILAFSRLAEGAEIKRDYLYSETGITYGGISIRGEIVAGDELAFRSLAAKLTGARVIVDLESSGGNPLVAIAIGRLIRVLGYSTHVSVGYCASACGLIWLAGNQRFTGATGKVGFHAAYNSRTLQEVGAANALIGAYLNELGLSDKAIYYVTHANPTHMQWLNASDADKVGILAEVLSDLQTTPPVGTLERKWVDYCLEAIWDERVLVQYADNVVWGFCGCVAQKIIKTTTPDEFLKPRPRPKVANAFRACRQEGCEHKGESANWWGLCPDVERMYFRRHNLDTSRINDDGESMLHSSDKLPPVADYQGLPGN